MQIYKVFGCAKRRKFFLLVENSSHQEIEKEYGVTEEGIKAALRYATEVISEEQVSAVKVKA